MRGFVLACFWWACVGGQSILVLNTSKPSNPQGQTAIVDVSVQTGGSFDSSAQGTLTLEINGTNPRAYFWASRMRNLTSTLVQGRATVLLTSNYKENITVRVSFSNVSVSSGKVQNMSVCPLSFVADVPRVLWMDSLGAADGLFGKHMVIDSQRNVYLTLTSQLVQKRSPAHQVLWTKDVSSNLTGLALSPDESAVYAIADGYVFKFNSTGTLLWNVSNGPIATWVPVLFDPSVPTSGIVVTPANQVICVGRRFFNSTLVIMWQLDPKTGAVVANLTQDTTGDVTLHRVAVDRNSGSVWAYGTFNATCVIANQTINFISRPYEGFLIQVFPLSNATPALNLPLRVNTTLQVAWPGVNAYEVAGYHSDIAGVSLEVDVYGDVIVAVPVQTSSSYGNGAWTMKIVKFSRGTVSWTYDFGGAAYAKILEQTSLVSDSTGNMYLAMTARDSYTVNDILIQYVSLLTYDPRRRTSNVLKLARDGTLLYAKCFAASKESFVKKLAIERTTNFVVALGDVVGNMTLDASVMIDTGIDNVQFLTALTPSILEYPLAWPQQLTTAEDTALLITLNGSYFQQPVGPGGIAFRGRIDKLPVSGMLFTVLANGSMGIPIGTEGTILGGLDVWYVPPPYKHSGLCRSGLCNGTQPFEGFEYSLIAYGAVSLASARIDIVVSAVPNPPIANAQVVSAAENVVLVITLTGSSFDGPPNGPDLNLSAVITRAPPSNEGSLYQFDLSTGSLLGLQISANSTYVQVSNPHNQILYLSPNNRGNFTTNFDFLIFDGLFNSVSAQVVVRVEPINQRPVAEDQAVANGGRIVLEGTDIDSAASLLRFFVVDLPKQGHLFQCVAGGKGPEIDIPHTLVTDSAHCIFYEALGVESHDTFTFLVNDGQLDSTPARVTIGACAPGYFQNTTKNECEACESGRFSSAPDQLQCSACLASYYQLQEGQSSCQPCPLNVDICAGNVVVVSPNYWALTSSAASKVAPVQCLPKYCLGSNLCSENRVTWDENPLCGKCLPGYSEWGTSCIDCFQSNGGSTFAVLLICLGATLILRWSVASLNARGSDGMVFAYFIQCALLIVGSTGNSALTFLHVFDFSFADSAVPSFSLSCPFYVGPLQKFGLSLGLVFLLFLDLGLILLFHFVIFRVAKRPFGRVQLDGYIRAACTLFLLAFNKITQMCIQYLSCKDTGVSRVVVTQPGIECTTTAYANYLILVCIGLTLCLLVGPGLILYLLTQKTAEKNGRYFNFELAKSTYEVEPSEEAKRFEARWGSFFAPFAQHACWYQLVVLARRTILILFDSALVNDPQARSVMILLATLTFFLLHLRIQPYRAAAISQTKTGSESIVTANRLEAVSLLLHLVLAVLIGPYQVPYPEGIIWTATVLICSALILFVVYQLWKYAQVFRAKHKPQASLGL